MGKPRQSHQKASKRPPRGDSAGRAKRREQITRRKGDVQKRLSWFQGKRPVLRFVVIFGVCTGAFYAITATSFFEEHGWVPYLDLNAEVSAAVIGLWDDRVTISGRSISGGGASIMIERGCDAIHPSGLFIAAVLAAPTSLRSRLFGAFAGTSLLMLTNLIRIISLFYIRMYSPDLFQMMHLEVWQAVFIFLALLLWVIWARWALRDRSGQPDASA